jgi:hypothetical protein
MLRGQTPQPYPAQETDAKVKLTTLSGTGNWWQRSQIRSYTARETDVKGQTHDLIQRVTLITRLMSWAPRGEGARHHTERLPDHNLYRAFQHMSSVLILSRNKPFIS